MPSEPMTAAAETDHEVGTASIAVNDLVTPGGPLPGRGTGFRVQLENFEGPFDLLLGLIAKHQLDVTHIAIAKVTDEFIAWIKECGDSWDISEASQFLVVAATLLDLKAARLLPATEVEDAEDLALLEARDLLFARLLQYRAFKEVANDLQQRWDEQSRLWPRSVTLEPQFASLLPELVLGISPEQFALIASQAMRPKPPPMVGLAHLHAPAVSVREQAVVVVERLRQVRAMSFRALVADADTTLVVVARFLALLELFRDAAVAFDQATPLGELTIRWTGPDDTDESDAVAALAIDEFDGVTPASEPALDPEQTPKSDIEIELESETAVALIPPNLRTNGDRGY